jgi:hypothetical protein
VTTLRGPRDAFGHPGVLLRSYPGPFGNGTGAEILQIRLADLLTRGWDLAQATANPADLPEDLANLAHHDSPNRGLSMTRPLPSNSSQLSSVATSPRGNNR